MYIVYLLKNSTDGKMYVGSTKNFHRRMYRHGLAKEGHLLSQAIASEGIKNFEVYCIDSSDEKKDALQKERKWAFELNTLYPNGYNLRAGAGEWTEQVKKKISRSAENRKHSAESILKCRQAKLNKMKKVVCVETGVTYESIADCCRQLGLNKGSFSFYFRGITKSIGGFTFERTM